MNHDNPIDDDRLAALPVQDGLDALLRELVHEHAPAAPVEPTTTRRRWPLVVAAAASVAVVAAVPAYLGRSDVPAPRSPADSAPSPSQPIDPTTATPTTPTPHSEVVQPAPRVTTSHWVGPAVYALLDAPGWTVEVDSVSTQASYGVEVTYVSGGQRLGLSWVREKWFTRDVRDAQQEPTAGTIEVLGQQATYVTYESQQQMAYLPVRDGYGLRVDGAFTTPSTFEALVGDLRTVDEDAFAQALPGDVVTPARSEAVAQQMLDDSQAAGPTVVRAPVGFNGRYQVAAGVVGDIGCAWLHQWVDGDADERAEAEDALAGSRTWAPIVDDLRQPGWFEITVRMMRREAPDGRVLGSAGCQGPGTTGDDLIDALLEPRAD